MQKTIFIILILCLMPISAYSHPGGLDKNGCHMCRTNCDKWGVPWNQKHCHRKRNEAPVLHEVKEKQQEANPQGDVLKTIPGWEYGMEITNTKTGDGMNEDLFEDRSIDRSEF